MVAKEIIIYKTWRSEAKLLTLFFVTAVLSSYLTYLYPETVIKGDLFSVAGYTIILDLPLLWLVPVSFLLAAMIRIYNVRYYLNKHGVRSVEGILALNKKVTSLKYEDIRLIDVKQKILDRILGIGTLDLATAATGTVEISLRGVAAPYEIKRLIQNERDARLAMIREQGLGSAAGFARD